MSFRIRSCEKYLAGVDHSGRGFNPRPAQTLCRSGIVSPTGTIHPRKSIGQTTKNRNQRIIFLILVFYTGVGRGLPPRPCAGRGLNPRPERSTHARALDMTAKNGNQSKYSLRGMSFRIRSCEKYLAGVDRSGRGYNPRPAQGRPAQAESKRRKDISHPSRPCSTLRMKHKSSHALRLSAGLRRRYAG